MDFVRMIAFLMARVSDALGHLPVKHSNTILEQGIHRMNQASLRNA